MKKLIIRNKVLTKGYALSKLIRLTADNNLTSIQDFMNKHGGVIQLMNDLYEERIASGCLDKTDLYHNYKKILTEEKENEAFKIMYQIDKDFCVSLTENIYIYHIVPTIEIKKERLIPWDYVDSKIYAGDTWWEDNITILSDIENISIIDFIKKYKAF